ncbi:Sec7 guanine-nucleotide-exchange factor, partial [Helicosporidium sp. ATCC 50920]
MRAFVEQEDCRNLPLDEALRRLLAGFVLPGEAQKIDRIVEAFAARYCACNPEAFASPDGAYLLAFAAVMLNTDAHNPQAERRIAAADFVLMAQQEADGGEFVPILPADQLLDMHARILARQFEVPRGGTAEDDEAGDDLG